MKTKTLKLFLLLIVIPVGLTSCFNEMPGEQSLEDLSENSGLEQDFSVKENSLDYKSGEKGIHSFTPYSKKDSSRSYTIPNVQRWQMISTGQNKCYDNYGEISCPEIGEKEYPQSGAVSYGTRIYTSGGDGTVKDDVTGLTWQAGYMDEKTWYEAKNYCDSLTLAGKRWRLPLTHELRSLVNYSVVDPSIDISAFPDTPSDWFWSSKHVNYDTINGGTQTVASWIISFIDGSVEYTARDNKYSVRCVEAE